MHVLNFMLLRIRYILSRFARIISLYEALLVKYFNESKNSEGDVVARDAGSCNSILGNFARNFT